MRTSISFNGGESQPPYLGLRQHVSQHIRVYMDEVVWLPNPSEAERYGLRGHWLNMRGISQSLSLSSSTFYLDVNGLLTCRICASIEEVTHVHTLVIPEAIPRPLLFQGIVVRQHSTKVAIWAIL